MVDENKLAKIVEEEIAKGIVVVKPCAELGSSVGPIRVPRILYLASKIDQKNNIRRAYTFPGGLISEYGGVYSSRFAYSAAGE